MSVKTLEVDGKTITGVTGESIFKVAWEHGIHIPRLCHIGGISDVGACRLCMVEVEGQRKLQAHRKLIVELLLAERNHVCAVCVANGACELQELARSVGIEHVRLRYRFP